MMVVPFSEKRYRCWLLVLLGCYLLYIVVFFVPEYRLFQKRRDFSKEVYSYLEKKELQENYHRLKEEKDIKANKLSGLENRLYSIPEEYQLINHLQKILLTSGIKLKSCQFDVVKFEKIYPSQKIVLNLSGRFDQIIRMFSLVSQEYLYHDLIFILTSTYGEIQCLLEITVYLRPEQRGIAIENKLKNSI